MNIRIIFLLAFFSTFLLKIGFSQEFIIEQLGEDEGIDTNSIYEIKESKSHHLYIGTDKGLLKYNGDTFKRVDTPHADNEEIFQLTFVNDSTFVYSNMAKQLCIGVNNNIDCENIGLEYLVSGITKLNDSLLYIMVPVAPSRQEILYDFINKKVRTNSGFGLKLTKERLRALSKNKREPLLIKSKGET